MRMNRLRSLWSSVLLGLTAACGVGAVVLLASAVLRLQVDCGELGAEECTFEEQLAASIARLQTLAAVGCACLAGAGALVLRRLRAR